MSPWWEEGWQRAPRLGGTRRQAATAPSWQCPTDSRTSQEPSLEKFSRSLDVTAQPLAYCCLDTDAALNPRPAGGHDGGRPSLGYGLPVPSSVLAAVPFPCFSERGKATIRHSGVILCVCHASSSNSVAQFTLSMCLLRGGLGRAAGSPCALGAPLLPLSGRLFWSLQPQPHT